MKLLELEVENIRGIKNLKITPNGNNFVVWGPNGSGKSALIDAIDFLITGRVNRLTGEGTKDISLSKHGPHIDHKSEEAKIKATIKLQKTKQTSQINRCMANPSNLLCDTNNKEFLNEINKIEFLSKRGQHVLTRREILKYITAEGSTRAQEIQALLNISEIENVRKTLVKVNNDFEKTLKSHEKNFDLAKIQINATLQKTKFSEIELLNIINENRQILGGKSLDKIDSNIIKSDITPLTTTPTGQIVNINLFEKDIEYINSILSDDSKKLIVDNENNLRILLQEIISDPKLLRSLNQKALIDIGIKLIDDSGECPLCDTKWPAGEIEKYLKIKKDKSKLAEDYQKKLKPFSVRKLITEPDPVSVR